jgi:tetratricopeptide (TPR) repeat protein
MSRIKSLLLASFVLLFGIFATLNAQNTYALIVGISKYQEMPALQYADRDALAFADFVKSQGAPTTNIGLFLNEEATRIDIVDELFRLSKLMKANDRFYFYFSGHGDLEAQIGHENALLLLHGSFKKSYFQGKEFLHLYELREWLSGLSKRQIQVMFIADACHSGGLIGGKDGQSKTQRALQENWGNIGKILSSQANEYSLEGAQWGGGRGLFSFHLTNGLIGKADVNRDKVVSVEEIGKYLGENVKREASPSLQTPLVTGENKWGLSKVNPDALKKLKEAERLSYPIISSANLRANIDDLVGEMDQSLVDAYKKFSTALKEKRINTYDNKDDNAILHFRKMAGEKVPEHLLALMKRNLAAALIERELALMKPIRERGAAFVPRNEQTKIAVANLEEALDLFGPEHYFYQLLQARIAALKGFVPKDYGGPITNDQLQMEISRNRETEKKLLLKALELEPNMVSTYVLLAANYRAGRKLDSSLYYQQRIIELMPNEPQAYFNMALNYSSNAKGEPNTKAIESLNKVLALDRSFTGAHSMLASIYMGYRNLTLADPKDTTYHNFPAALPHVEALKSIYHLSATDIEQIAADTRESTLFFIGRSTREKPNLVKFYSRLTQHARLSFLYEKMGQSQLAKAHLDTIYQTIEKINTPYVYMRGCRLMYDLYEIDRRNVLLEKAVKWNEIALQMAEVRMTKGTDNEKLTMQMQHREMLKALGVTHRILKNFASAEKYLMHAIDYQMPLVIRRFSSLEAFFTPEPRFISVINGISEVQPQTYQYSIEPHFEMFNLKMDEGKKEDALYWFDRTMQHSKKEGDNDLSQGGIGFIKNIFNKMYQGGLDTEALIAIHKKYFPEKHEKK